MKSDRLIGIVGPCKSGKSSLVKGLETRGYRARQISQEHSYAPKMWQEITKPDMLIYLDVSYQETVERGMGSWQEQEYEEQIKRLEHAREQANLHVGTDDKSIRDVLEEVVKHLESD